MVRIDDSNDRTKCWIDFNKEGKLLEEKAREKDWEQEIAIQLLLRVGCRVSGIFSVKPEGISWNEKGEYWQVRVRGKNTKGGEKTVRDAYLPDRVKENLDRYASERDIEQDEPYISVAKSTVRNWVSQCAKEIADETGEQRWEYVSTHDLRRSWATHYLVEEGVQVRVMMEIGGWSSYDAIESYLDKPSPQKIGSEMNSIV